MISLLQHSKPLRTSLKLSLKITAALLLGLGVRGYSQTTALDNLIAEGLKSNLVIAQKHIESDKAVNALEEAKRLFRPNVDFNGGYLTGTGGRYIDLPIGDLLNPVYGTLNQLTQSRAFPQIENVKTTFFPQDQYDLKLRTSAPLVNPALYYNRDIQAQQVQLKAYDIEVYQRELVKDIKVAYFNYLTAIEAQKAYSSAGLLVNKSLEISSSLVRNGKAIPATLSRIRAEQERINAQQIETRNQADNARRYLNFLLNRDQQTAVDTSYDETAALAAISKQLAVNKPGVQDRTELRQLDLAIAINKNVVSMNERYWVPRVSSFLDLGNQSVNGFRVDRYSPYVLFGVNVDMPVWNWNRNKLKIAKSQLEVSLAELNRKQQGQAIELAAQVASTNLKSAWSAYEAALKQLQAAENYYQVIERGYREGTSSLIEYLDARNQVTIGITGAAVAQYKALQALAIIERETASFNLTKNN